MTTRYGATRAELDALARSARRARATAPTQLYDGLYDATHGRSTTLTNLPKALRDRLADALPLALEPVDRCRPSDDGTTVKWLWQAARRRAGRDRADALPDRATVCVSSQAGCAMGCTFCATGQAGFERHLDAGEIVEQVVRAQHVIAAARVATSCSWAWASRSRTSTPCCDALERAARRPRHLGPPPHGLDRRRRARHAPARRVPPAGDARGVAARARRRRCATTLVPLNRRYPIAEVLDAAARRTPSARAGGSRSSTRASTASTTSRTRPTRSPAACTGLPRRRPREPHPAQPDRRLRGPGARPRRASPASRRRLAAAGVRRTVRRNRGVDIDAACGQLRARRPNPRADRPAHRCARSARMAP